MGILAACARGMSAYTSFVFGHTESSQVLVGWLDITLPQQQHGRRRTRTTNDRDGPVSRYF